MGIPPGHQRKVSSSVEVGLFSDLGFPAPEFDLAVTNVDTRNDSGTSGNGTAILFGILWGHKLRRSAL